MLDAAKSSAEVRRILTKHLRKVKVKKRVGEKNVICEFPGCGRRYYYPTDLRYHVLRCHTDEKDKPFPCTHPGCSKRFAENSSLQNHMRTHTGDKPYMCDHPGCGRKFAQFGNLRIHKRCHTDARPYQCTKVRFLPFLPFHFKVNANFKFFFLKTCKIFYWGDFI